MKYIKAKIVNGETKIYPSDIDKGFLSCVCAEIISEADTIEELCDEFVYGIDKINEKPLVAQQNFLETKIKIAKLFKCDLYGAIWTDKGLIYVAKVNDKGELELI